MREEQSRATECLLKKSRAPCSNVLLCNLEVPSIALQALSKGWRLRHFPGMGEYLGPRKMFSRSNTGWLTEGEYIQLWTTATPFHLFLDRRFLNANYELWALALNLIPKRSPPRDINNSKEWTCTHFQTKKPNKNVPRMASERFSHACWSEAS